MLEIASYIAQWIFFAYTSYLIGKKLNVNESYPWYLIPLWNFWILAKYSNFKIKKILLFILVAFFISIIIAMIVGIFLIFSIQDGSAISIIAGADGPTSIFILNRLAPDMIARISYVLLYLIIIIAFWGAVAKNMEKDYIFYGFISLISPYLPPLCLAFDAIEKFFTTNNTSNMYRLLSEDEKQALALLSKPMDTLSKRMIYLILSLVVALGLSLICEHYFT